MAEGSAETTSRFSIVDISVARISAPNGARTATETASIACALPKPSFELIAPATFCAVVKSARARLKVSVGALSNPVATARSTVAPSGMRPVEGTLTTIFDPSAPSAPKPPTARLPCAIA